MREFGTILRRLPHKVAMARVLAVFALAAAVLYLNSPASTVSAQEETPAPPTIEEVYLGDGSLFVRWKTADGPPNPDKHQIRYGETEDTMGSWTDVPSANRDVHPLSLYRYYIIEGLTNGTEYTVEVRGIYSDEDGNEVIGQVASDSYTPSELDDLSYSHTATPIGYLPEDDDYVEISWDSVPNSSVYTVSWTRGDGRLDKVTLNGSDHGDNEQNSKTLTADDGIDPGATHVVMVKATVNSTEYTYMGFTSVDIKGPPDRPKISAASGDTEAKTITVSWNAVDNADNYKVGYEGYYTVPFSGWIEVEETSYTFTNVTYDKKFVVFLTAVNEYGESPWDGKTRWESKTITVAPPKPPAPTGFVSTSQIVEAQGEDTLYMYMELSWDRANESDTYEVRYREHGEDNEFSQYQTSYALYYWGKYNDSLILEKAIYDIELRAVSEHGGKGPSVSITVGNDSDPTQIKDIPENMELVTGASTSFNFTEYFKGTGLSYVVGLQTLNADTGFYENVGLTEVPNIISGSISGSTLTLTAGQDAWKHADFKVWAVDTNGVALYDLFTIRIVEPDPAKLRKEFADINLENNGSAVFNMEDYFEGDGLTYEALVTTTHQKTGKEKTGALNTVARNKITGYWDGTLLRLTGGTATPQTLKMEIKATDTYEGTASDSFTVSLIKPTVPDAPNNPATLLKNFDDIEMSIGDTLSLDMSDYFSGDGLTYSVTLQTTNQVSGVVKTGALNKVARNKVTGTWDAAVKVLTLQGGHAVSQELTMTFTATDQYAGTASDELTFTLDNDEDYD